MDLEVTTSPTRWWPASTAARTRAPRPCMSALVRHLHAFAREVDLTEDEYFAGIDFLTRTGQISTGTRQEFVLLADVLGLSMLTVGLGNRNRRSATESTVFGPFFVEGSPAIADGGDLSNGAPGQPCLVRARVLDDRRASRSPVRWSRSGSPTRTASTTYRRTLDGPQNRGHLRTDADGQLLRSGRSGRSPTRSPTTGRSASCSRAAGRGPMRPAHIHFMVTAPGFAG